MAADNAVRGQLHSLMDPPHITVTYTYVSFVKSEYRHNVHSTCLPTGPAGKNERSTSSILRVFPRVIGLHRVPPFLSALLRVIRVTFNVPLIPYARACVCVYTCQGKIDARERRQEVGKATPTIGWIDLNKNKKKRRHKKRKFNLANVMPRLRRYFRPTIKNRSCKKNPREFERFRRYES